LATSGGMIYEKIEPLLLLLSLLSAKFCRFHCHRPQQGMNPDTQAVEFRYQCAQDIQTKCPSQKNANPSKCRDRRSMTFFNCQSHLNITIQVMNQVVIAKIDLKHMDDHIPYQAVTIPPDVLSYIEVNRTKSMKTVSNLQHSIGTWFT